MALTNKLSAIGNAIREKTGKTELLTLDEMATEITEISVGSAAVINPLTIESNGTYTASDCDGYSPITVKVPQDGAPTAEELTFTGLCNYRFYSDGWNWILNKYGNQITTSNLINTTYMFANCNNISKVPFELNFSPYANSHYIESTFSSCQGLTEVPKFNQCKPDGTQKMFYGCTNLRTIPEDIESWFDWSYIDTRTSAYYCSRQSMFQDCYSLRSIPMGFLNHGNPIPSTSYAIYANCFSGCLSLDEIIGLPVPHFREGATAKATNNMFGSTFDNCSRVKNIIFATNEDGTPINVRWTKQTITISTYVGRASSIDNIVVRNNGITRDKAVTDAATYEALKNDPDWFTNNLFWSRYNHDSAVATINSLPNSVEDNPGNVIKFVGEMGLNTDGGAINTLTEEEIAVATAKGWTVTLT